MSIRVTHVVRQYLPSVGGLEEVVRNIVSQQNRTPGHHARVVTLDRLFRNSEAALPKQEWVGGVDVLRLPFIGSSRYPLCPSVLKNLDDSDIIHVHGVDFFFDFLALTKWRHRRPLVLSTHGGFFHTSFASTLKTCYFHTVTRLSSLAYDKVIATSRNDGDIFSRIVPAKKLQVIENGVDVEKYADQSATQPTKTLIYFGRWSSNKGILQMLSLFQHLSAADPEWRLIIAGREYDHTHEELQSQVTEMQLHDKVTLAANPSDLALKQLIHRAEYFICLSRHEGFGIAPIEAMSAGLVPILSDIPPFRQLHKNTGSGLIINAENCAQSAQAVARFHREHSPDHHHNRTQAMQSCQRYAWSRVAQNYMAVYEKVGGET